MNLQTPHSSHQAKPLHSLTGTILSRQQRETRSGIELIFWLASEQGSCEVIIPQQRLVFLLPTAQLAEARKLWQTHRLQPLEVRQLSLKTFNHQPVTAVYLATSAELNRCTELLQQHAIPCYEADIKLSERFLMERFIRGQMRVEGEFIRHNGHWRVVQPKLSAAEAEHRLRLVSLDIECSPQSELYSIGLSYGNAAESGQSVAEVIMIGTPQPADDIDIQWVADEKALLLALQDWFVRHDPDLIIGWAVAGFDLRLLAMRAERYGMRLKLGRDGSALRWLANGSEPENGTALINGRVVLDGIEQLKNACLHFERYSLEFVSQSLFGEGKLIAAVEDKGAEIKRQFETDPVALARYNLQDCILVERIFAHEQLIDYALQRARLTGLPLQKRGGSVAAFTNLYLPLLHRSGYIAPNLGDIDAQHSPGGYVMNSSPGLYNWVLVLDFKSLYPSIIRTFRIDPMGLIAGLTEPPADSIPGFRGARFSRTKHHLPAILDRLAEAREQAKQQHNQIFQYAIKIIMNSMYGVLGSAGCRFHDTRLASSITLRGHQIMQDTKSFIESLGDRVIYGDTDSTFVWLENCNDLAQATQQGKMLEQAVNHYWQQRLQQEFKLESQLEIEFETCFRRFFMPTIRGSETGSKKRYAGIKVTDSGEQLLFKGLETVRTDWTALAHNFQQQLYARVFAGEPVEALIRQTVEQLKQGQLDSDLVYHKRLRRPLAHYRKNLPPQVRAARLADEINRASGKPLRYQKRGRIGYLITLNGPEPQEYSHSSIDYQHYIDKQLRPIADAILPFINRDFDQIISTQMGLF